MTKRNKHSPKPEKKTWLDGEEAKAFVRDIVKRIPERRYEDDLIGALNSARAQCAKLGEVLTWLGAYDLDPAVSEDALLLLFFAGETPDLSKHEKDVLMAQAGLVAREASRSGNVPDERKFRLAVILEKTGDGELVEAVLKKAASSQKTRDRMAREACRQLARTPQALNELLNMLELSGEEDEPPDPQAFLFVDSLIEELHAKNPGAAALLAGTTVIAACGYAFDEAASAMLERMRQLPSPQVAWALRELGDWPGLVPEAAAHARVVASEFTSKGIAPSFSVDRTFSHGLLTSVDGSGSQSVTVFYLTKDGTMDAASVIYNLRTGFRAAHCVYDDGYEVEFHFQEAAYEEDLRLAFCSLALAREFLADIWAQEAERESPVPHVFFMGRPYFGAEPIVPKRRTPDLSPYCMQSLTVNADLLDDAEATLASSLAHGTFRFTSDSAYQFVIAHQPAGARNFPKKRVLQFAREIAIADREFLIDMLAANLEFEAQGGRAHHDDNRLAARTWLGMKEQVAPFDTIPYVRELCAISLGEILSNVRAGFDNQADADEAAMMMDGLGLEDDGLYGDEDYEDDEDNRW